MTISELIVELIDIKRRHGDLNVTWEYNKQFADVLKAEAVTSASCPPDLLWCFSSPVVLLTLDKE